MTVSVYLASVHSLHRAVWESLARKARCDIAGKAAEADVLMLMTASLLINHPERWIGDALSGKRLILGRASPGCRGSGAIERALWPTVRHHIFSHRGLAEDTLAAARRTDHPEPEAIVVPKTYDFEDEIRSRSNLSPSPRHPDPTPLERRDIIALINHYPRFHPREFADFERLRGLLDHVSWYGRGSPGGIVNDVERLATARFLVHMKSGGCVDNAPGRAVSCGVPVLTTQATHRRSLIDEVVVDGVSGKVFDTVEEMAVWVRGLTDARYLELRRTTWEHGARWRRFEPRIIEEFARFTADAAARGTTVAAALDSVERCRQEKWDRQTREFLERGMARRKPGCDLEQTDAGIAVVDPIGGRHGINPPMALVWELCDGNRRVEDVADAIGARLGAEGPDRAVLYEDVLDSLVALWRSRLIQVRGAGPKTASRRSLPASST